jgi:hypothetical protein
MPKVNRQLETGRHMNLIGLISPNLTENTLVDVYKILPEGTRIEGRALKVEKFTDEGFSEQRSTSRTLSETCYFIRWISSWSRVSCFFLTRLIKKAQSLVAKIG